MYSFRVASVVDGDTFDVNPSWIWGGYQGNRIRVVGYDAPELGSIRGVLARNKLTQLILGKVVVLGSAYKIDRGRLICDAFLDGRHLKDYFQEFQ